MRIISKSLFLCFLFIFSLDAGVEHCFKAATNKPEPNGIENIDFIYVINLDQRPERFQRTQKVLLNFGIHPYRFSAVNGWELPVTALTDLGVFYEPWMPQGTLCTVYRIVDGKDYVSNEIMKEEGIAYYCHCLSRGAIGCLLSHLSVLQDAYDSGYNTAWIMEDDIKVISNPHELSYFLDVLNQQNPDWDVFFLVQ